MNPIIPHRTVVGTTRANRRPSTRWALASLSLAMVISSLATSIATAGLPTLAHAFSASFQAVQWIVLAYMLTVTTLIVSVGRLGDIIGRRRFLVAGLSLFTVASGLCGAAPALWFLIAARALQGLGAAIMLALTIACASEMVPPEKIGSTMGVLGTMSAIGTTLGPSLGGLLIAGLGWRTIFLINVPLGILNVLLVRRFLPADRQTQWADRNNVDTMGIVVLAATLAGFALSVTSGPGSGGMRTVTLLAASVVGAALFVRVEARAAAPLIRLALFHHAVLRASLAMSTLVSTVMMATLVVGPFYLARALGLDAARIGMAVSLGPLVAALSGVPAGRLVDRFGTHRITLIGLSGLVAASVMLTIVPVTVGIAGYLIPIGCMTASYGLFQAATTTAIMTSIHPDQRGVISGLLSLSRNLGFIMGTAAMGAVFARAAGTPNITSASADAVATGMRSTVAVAAILIGIAFVIAVASRTSGHPSGG